ncbi:unnamed protein product [Thlaspi arvense]|uniref:Uncharacterized protein n=1 Tax=Thlaspi arvense TaxID=13288 RepID=A0AAU9SM42_THLAR|nr:unnamed protein product [Thlaspi arvense]
MKEKRRKSTLSSRVCCSYKYYGPVLLELATKIMTSGIVSSDQVAVKRILSLLSSTNYIILPLLNGSHMKSRHIRCREGYSLVCTRQALVLDTIPVNHSVKDIACFTLEFQATALQVLKSLIQRFNNAEERSFVIFFVGDIVSLMQGALLKQMSKESVVIAGECLRLIMLTSDGVSQVPFLSQNMFCCCCQQHTERSFRIKSVKHFACKNSEITIRASVSQDSALPKPKSLVPPMDIKLPAPEKVTSSADMVKAGSLSTAPNDDWDTFQSFPASTNPQVSESKAESIAEEEPDSRRRSCIHNETNNTTLAEEVDDQPLASDGAADTTREDSVDRSKRVEETLEPSLIEEALTSKDNKTPSEDHLAESE